MSLGPEGQKIRRMSPGDQQTAWDLYFNQRVSSEEIAKRLGFSGPAIRMFLKKKGGVIRGNVECHRSLPLNEHAFDTLTPESSYWLGVLLTDGCVYDQNNTESSPRVELTWEQADKDHLLVFDAFMGGGNRITKKVRAKGTYFRWDARSQVLADKLLEYGISARKTKTAKPSENLKYSHDFWRGCWDGDGEVDEGNNCPLLTLIGSFPLIQSFCDYFATIDPTYPLQPRPSGNTSCTAVINLHGQGGLVLLRTLYSNPGVAMPRKLKLAQEMLSKFDGRTFRVLKPDIHQRNTFPYHYTMMGQAIDDFKALKELEATKLIQPLVKGAVTHIETSIINKSRVGAYSSSFFHESVRMQARCRGKLSPIQMWEDLGIREKIIHEAKVGKHSSVRASMSANCQPCWGFMPAVAKAVYQHFNAKCILDPCAGWGDRLTAAFSLPDLERYDGYDPNSRMADVYQRIMNCYGGQKRASVETAAFESVAVPEGLYDLAFTSPPYFDYEEYSDDPDQSYKKYPTPDLWREGFLTPLMKKCALAVRSGGVVAINISDAGKAPLVDWLIKAAESCPNLKFIGTLFMQTGNFDRAHEGIYCWRKI